MAVDLSQLNESNCHTGMLNNYNIILVALITLPCGQISTTNLLCGCMAPMTSTSHSRSQIRFKSSENLALNLLDGTHEVFPGVNRSTSVFLTYKKLQHTNLGITIMHAINESVLSAVCSIIHVPR